MNISNKAIQAILLGVIFALVPAAVLCADKSEGSSVGGGSSFKKSRDVVCQSVGQDRSAVSPATFIVSSLAVSAITGAVCGLVDLRTDCKFIKFSWLANGLCNTAVINAMGYHAGESKITKKHAVVASMTASFLAWGLVYFGVPSK